MLNNDKCVFRVSEITFQGHLGTKKGIKFLPQKVEAIEKFLPFKKCEAVASFFGMANHYSHSIPH